MTDEFIPIETSEFHQDPIRFPAGVHKLTRVPKGNDVKGKVWKDADILLPDGRTVEGRYESNRGAFVYFIVDGQHYRAFTDRFMTIREGKTLFDLAPR